MGACVSTEFQQVEGERDLSFSLGETSKALSRTDVVVSEELEGNDTRFSTAFNRIELVEKDHSEMLQINAAITELLKTMPEEEKDKIDTEALDDARKVGSAGSKTDAVFLQYGALRAHKKDAEALVVLVAHRTILVKDIGEEESIPETGDFYNELAGLYRDWGSHRQALMFYEKVCIFSVSLEVGLFLCVSNLLVSCVMWIGASESLDLLLSHNTITLA